MKRVGIALTAVAVWALVMIGLFTFIWGKGFCDTYGWPDEEGLPIPREEWSATKFTVCFPDREFSGLVGDYFTVTTPLKHKMSPRTFFEKEMYLYDVAVQPKVQLYDELKENQALTRDACLYVNDLGEICIEPSVGYRDYDVNDIVDEIAFNISQRCTKINVANYVTGPTYTTEEAENDLATYSWLGDFAIEYSCGMSLTGHDIAMQCFSDGKLDLSLLDVTHFLDALNVLCLDERIAFKTTDTEKTALLPLNTYDNSIDFDAEKNFIKCAIEAEESKVDRVPFKMGQSLENEYVEVSIGSQHVWHYVNGRLCCGSDCVTGKCDNRHETPTGVFQIISQENGRALRPQGATSSTWVNKWMKISLDGVGLHDATWRSEFGGDIYKNDGSHGCINLPKDYAYALYDEVSLGTPVVVHE